MKKLLVGMITLTSLVTISAANSSEKRVIIDRDGARVTMEKVGNNYEIEGYLPKSASSAFLTIDANAKNYLCLESDGDDGQFYGYFRKFNNYKYKGIKLLATKNNSKKIYFKLKKKFGFCMWKSNRIMLAYCNNKDSNNTWCNGKDLIDGSEWENTSW